MGVFEPATKQSLRYRVAENWRVVVFSLLWTALQLTLAIKEILPMSNPFVQHVVFPIGFSLVGAIIIAWELFRLMVLTQLSTYTECIFAKSKEGGSLFSLRIHIVNSRCVLWCDWQTTGGHIMLLISGIDEAKTIQIPPDECRRDTHKDVIINLVCELTPAETEKMRSRIDFPFLPTIQITQCRIMLRVRTLLRWVEKTVAGKETNVAIVRRFE